MGGIFVADWGNAFKDIPRSIENQTDNSLNYKMSKFRLWNILSIKQDMKNMLKLINLK